MTYYYEIHSHNDLLKLFHPIKNNYYLRVMDWIINAQGYNLGKCCLCHWGLGQSSPTFLGWWPRAGERGKREWFCERDKCMHAWVPMMFMAMLVWMGWAPVMRLAWGVMSVCYNAHASGAMSSCGPMAISPQPDSRLRITGWGPLG